MGICHRHAVLYPAPPGFFYYCPYPHAGGDNKTMRGFRSGETPTVQTDLLGNLLQ
jgi:hypothetical protein